MISSSFLFVFSYISLREFFILPFFKGLKHSPKAIFRSFSSASSLLGCSSLANLDPLVFAGVMLLVVVLSVYSSFPLIDVVGVVCLVITLPGTSGSKAQMIVPCNGVGAMAPVKPEVTRQS